MEMSQDMKNSGFKRIYKIALVGILILIFSIPFIGSDFHRSIVNILTVRRDKNGNKPRDIATAFIEAARAGKCEKAEKYWTKDSINVFEHGSGRYDSFEDFCRFFQQFETYTLSPATPSEGGGRWLKVRGVLPSGSRRGYSLYFDLVNNEWLLIRTSWSEIWHQQTEEEAHGVIKIMPPYKEQIKHPKTQVLVEKTVSVHRIDHDLINPHWVEEEPDGSVSYQLTPGSHEIEYREVLGELANQEISFITKELVVEEGYLYILDGYHVERQKIHHDKP